MSNRQKKIVSALALVLVALALWRMPKKNPGSGDSRALRINPGPSNPRTASPTGKSDAELRPDFRGLKQRYLSKVPESLRGRATVRVNVSGPQTWMMQLEIDGVKVALTDVRVFRNADGSWDYREAPLPELPANLPLYPKSDPATAESSIRLNLRDESRDPLTVKALDRAWITQPNAPPVPALEYQVDTKDAKGETHKEIWYLNAGTQQILSKQVRVRF